MLYRFFGLLALLILTNSCTRDDICAAGTATTPLLIITFKDINDQSVKKGVTGLRVNLIGTSSQTFLPNATNDSIAIPLNNNIGKTTYYFLRDVGGPTENTDKITFSYEPYAVYVNRACGYKENYSGLQATQEDGFGNDWILRLAINNPTVDNENKAHITIFH